MRILAVTQLKNLNLRPSGSQVTILDCAEGRDARAPSHTSLIASSLERFSVHRLAQANTPRSRRLKQGISARVCPL